MRWKHLAHTYLWQNVPRGLRRRALFHLTAHSRPADTRRARQRQLLWLVCCGQHRGWEKGRAFATRLCRNADRMCTASTSRRLSFNLAQWCLSPLETAGPSRAPEPLFSISTGHFCRWPSCSLASAWLLGRELSATGLGSCPACRPNGSGDCPLCMRSGCRVGSPPMPCADCRQTPVRVVPHPVAVHRNVVGASRCQREALFKTLLVFNMASSFARKNPLAAIDAFKLAFGNDPACRLFVKVANGPLYPEGYKALITAVTSAPNIQLVAKSGGGRSLCFGGCCYLSAPLRRFWARYR